MRNEMNFIGRRMKFHRTRARKSSRCKSWVWPKFESRANAGDILIGPEATRWFPSGRVIFPHARTLGRLVAGRNDFVSGDKLAPIYLRATNFIKSAARQPGRALKHSRLRHLGHNGAAMLRTDLSNYRTTPPAVGLTPEPFPFLNGAKIVVYPLLQLLVSGGQDTPLPTFVMAVRFGQTTSRKRVRDSPWWRW